MYVHEGDVLALSSGGTPTHEVMYDSEVIKTSASASSDKTDRRGGIENVPEVTKEPKRTSVSHALEKIYEDLRDQIKEKDAIIQTLSIRV